MRHEEWADLGLTKREALRHLFELSLIHALKV